MIPKCNAYNWLGDVWLKAPGWLLCLLIGCLLAVTHPADAQILTPQDLKNQLNTFQASSGRAHPPFMSLGEAGCFWSELGTLYQDAGMYDQANAAFRRALSFLRQAPDRQLDLARAMDEMGSLLLAQGDRNGAEALEVQAVELRERLGVQQELARSWYHLSILYLNMHQLNKARGYAERAVAVASEDSASDPNVKINSVFSLALSLCGSKRYSEAISAMTSGMSLIKANYGDNSFPSVFGEFLLGYAHWKAGEFTTAGKLMHSGLEGMEPLVGAQHPFYIDLETKYLSFLRKAHLDDEASTLEHKLHQTDRRYSPPKLPQAVDIAALF